MIWHVKYFALVTLLIVSALVGTTSARQSRIQRLPAENDTQLSTVRTPSPSFGLSSSVESSPKSASSLAALQDDSWFSWSNWRRILLRTGESPAGESRTFGLKRRLQMAMIPLVFKFGVISTMIFVLVALGLKTVFLLKTLLILNLAGVIAKLFIWKSEVASDNKHAHMLMPTYAQWIPQPPTPYHGAPANFQQGGFNGKEVHLHIHNGANKNVEHAGSWEAAQQYHNEPYGSYSNPVPSYAHPSQRRDHNKVPMGYTEH